MIARLASLAFGVALALSATAALADDLAARVEPNSQVPAGNRHYAASGFPDRIVASPAADAAHGFAVRWRTDGSVQAPLLEIAPADDTPGFGPITRITASSQPLQTENGLSHHHRADVSGLEPGALYVYRVQGKDTWSAWNQLRTAGSADQPMTFLYFGDTQNKNLSHVTRVVRAAQKAAPEANLSLFAGDLVSGGYDADDSEWGEWFAATGWLAQETMLAPAIGNHEYFEEFEDTPQERRVMARHWPATFALPGNGAEGAEKSTYWFDYQGVRFAVLDGTSAMDLGTAQAQARWLDQVLASNTQPWTIVVVHQPFYSPARGRHNPVLQEALLPVVRRHDVDLVLQGHDHTYGRRGEDGMATPQFVVSNASPKQYRLSKEALQTMSPVAEDTQLFQVLRIDPQRLHYEARTVTGKLYDAFELVRQADGSTRKVELEEGRIAPRRCLRPHAPTGRKDRCWE